MSQTPDRHPGPLEEDEELRLNSNPVGPTQPGAMNFNGSAFQMRDAIGVFDPRERGITEPEHLALDTLVHEIDENSYDEVIRNANGRVVSITVWTDPSKTLKIRETQVTRGFRERVTTVVTIQYDGLGAVKETLTETYVRACGKVVSITRVRA